MAPPHLDHVADFSWQLGTELVRLHEEPLTDLPVGFNPALSMYSQLLVTQYCHGCAAQRKVRTPKEQPEYGVSHAGGTAVAVDFPTATILELPAATTLEGGAPDDPAAATTTLDASVTMAATAAAVQRDVPVDRPCCCW